MTQHFDADDAVPVTFTVPITEPFARAAADALKDFREIASNGFTEELGGADADTPFRRDAQSFWALPDPTGEARRYLHSMMLDVVLLSWGNARDHVRALEHDVVMQPPPVWSPLTLSRSVMESCLLVHYLLDPRISAAKRLARHAGLWRTDVDHMEKTARAFGEEQQTGVARTAEHLREVLHDVGAVERTNQGGRRIGYEVDGERAALDINFTEEAKALPSYMPAPYRILSGAAHGRPWMTARARELAEGQDEELVGEVATVLTAVLAVSGSLAMGFKAWRDYFGVDVEESLERLHWRYQRLFVETVNLTVGDLA